MSTNTDTHEDRAEDITNRKSKNNRPYSTYISIWMGLVVLTGFTITVAGLNLGKLSVLGAILIAVVKSSLVILFFMNLKNEDRVFKIMLAVAVLTLMTIMLLTFVDVSFR
jgi:cytochrome c oxidase subunit IV